MGQVLSREQTLLSNCSTCRLIMELNLFYDLSDNGFDFLAMVFRREHSLIFICNARSCSANNNTLLLESIHCLMINLNRLLLVLRHYVAEAIIRYSCTIKNQLQLEMSNKVWCANSVVSHRRSCVAVPNLLELASTWTYDIFSKTFNWVSLGYLKIRLLRDFNETLHAFRVRCLLQIEKNSTCYLL